MSFEKSLVVRAQPRVIAAQAQSLFEREASKGCCPDLAPFPVALEPPYAPLVDPREILDASPRELYVRAVPPSPERLRRFRLWTPATQECDWLHSETFAKQLRALLCPCAFEIVGNQKGILVSFLCDADDEFIIRAALRGAFPQCELSPMPGRIEGYPPLRPSDDLILDDYHPVLAYSELLTRSGELQVSPFETLLSVLAEIRPPMVGIYQVLFQPVAREHDWHRNIALMIDLQFAMRLFHNPHAQSQYAQQTPSGQLNSMTSDVLTKSHNDKPLFAVLVRLCLAGGVADEAQHVFRALSTFMGLYQHGGHPLKPVTQDVYLDKVGLEQTLDLLRFGMTRRAGFLVNSAELTSLVHVIPAASFQGRGASLDTLKGAALPPGVLSQGILIGHQRRGASVEPVCIPEDLLTRLCHLAGKPGTGKSTAIETRVLAHIERGDGLVLLDPHADLVERLLDLIDPVYAEKVIFLDLGDENYVPKLNLMRQGLGGDLSRMADEFVAALKKVTSNWGDRLEHLLRHAIFGLLHLPNATLLDLAKVLTPKSKEAKRICDEVLEAVDNELSLQFFDEGLKGYASSELGAPQHKLSKMLLSAALYSSVCQSENAFNFREIMDSGKCLLVNLSTLGPNTRSLLGCFFLTFFHLAALNRAKTPPNKRTPFFVFADEAHMFVTDAIEDLVTQMRKYEVGLGLAHHFMSQFPPAQADALRQAEVLMVFGVPEKEAQHFARELGGGIEPEELTSLERGEAVVRIGTHVARIRALEPRPLRTDSARERILQLSRERYYRPRDEALKSIQQRYGHRAVRTPRLVTPAASDTAEDYRYDEL